MKTEQNDTKILNKSEENQQSIEEPRTVLINQPLNFVQTQNLFVFEFKSDTLSLIDLLRFKHSLAKKIIKKFKK
ncbi:unnamed protein product [Paramecium primaurelia]|uniref:Uncharacterized protein n=2 Tax=Paramecium TaxID=5884 RepID=A0A8S1X8W5_9CILI|nr:unnamed protein product [Paramecium primaurelia]CAD8197448.1 unnamed protein product [Paramecium pentaurelia]